MNSAQNVSDHLICQLKVSNLNFVLHETPYSAQITIKKCFVNRFSGSEPSLPAHGSQKIDSANTMIDSLQYLNLNETIEALKIGNIQLNAKLEESEKDRQSSREIIGQLEGK